MAGHRWSAAAGHARSLAHQGRCHCWLLPPLQVHSTSWVPLVVLNPGSSRHLPEAGLTSSPFTACHCWLAPPLQVHHSMRVPLAVLAPVMSMQPPSICRVPLLATVQFCAAVLPSQSHICTLLPGVPLPLLLSTQLAPLSPATIGPVAPLPPPNRPFSRSACTHGPLPLQAGNQHKVPK